MNPRELGAAEAARAIAAKKISSRELTQALIEAAAERTDLHAFITLDADKALAAADAADRAIAAGKGGPLAGVPLAIKDNIDVAGLPTTAGSPALQDNVPARSAPVAEALTDAGAVILGKANMHELAFGITSINAHFGAVANPYDTSRFAGGSSGGAAAAVAARLAPAGLGSDTGGSVRIPSALCGIAGLRPSTGRYSQQGLVPMSATRDAAGPMARTVEDLALLDATIAGSDPVTEPAALKGIRLGAARPFTDNVDKETDRVFREALKKLEEAGAELVPLDLSAVAELGAAVGFPTALYEFRRGLPAYLEAHGVRITLEELVGRIESGDVRDAMERFLIGDEAISDADYRAALVARPQLQSAYTDAFVDNRVTALVFPTTPLPAQEIATGGRTVTLNGETVPTFPTFIRNTDPSACAGIPGISLPAGLTRDGLPVGLELEAPGGSDRKLLAVALAAEAVLGRPPPP